MCSFAFTNFVVSSEDLHRANRLQRLRGPDTTVIKEFGGNILLHNLLSITGNYLEQPLFNKQGDIALLFNGEIYNYKQFGSFNNDTECLLKLYEEEPDKFFNYIDGEFSFVICNLKKQELIIVHDTFGTKPMSIGKCGNRIGISSYPSFLLSLGMKQIGQCKPNTAVYYSLKERKIISQHEITKFQLNQHKDSYEDWMTSFSNSIQKRTKNTSKNIFMAFSSGYDSGVIFHELNKQNIKFDTFYIPTNEDADILNDRSVFFSDYKNFNKLILGDDDNTFYKTVENFDYNINNQSVFTDNAAKGMYKICEFAKKRNNKILISGQGADEIFSDYGIFGQDIYNYSTFCGVFPENLYKYFPWNNFYGGKQRAYLLKEESVCGSWGIEARYPFLDKDVVQEFLYLDVRLKNRRYKSPLDYYLNKYKFPYLMNDKKGFSPK